MGAAAILFVAVIQAHAGDDLRLPRKAAAEVEKAMLEAEKLELLSLHGGEPDGQLPEQAGSVKFHDYVVIGSLDLSTASERTTVVRDVAKAIASSPVYMAACFFPRHGLRATSKTGEQVDLLICFECATVYRFSSGKKLRLSITDEPESLLNKLFKKAGIPQGRSARGPSA
jgi:hypothetical protein